MAAYATVAAIGIVINLIPVSAVNRVSICLILTASVVIIHRFVITLITYIHITQMCQTIDY